ncbi:MAG: bifunctional DNA primase/polymerase [Gemmataceae bacterium]
MTAASSKLTDTGRAALDYGRAGLKVFPILEGTKDRPLISQWGIRASSDPKQITEWWTHWPKANIGLACGPSDIGVIDSDVKPDGTGEDTLRELDDLQGKVLSPTKMARTPSGGIHRFYRGTLATTAGKLGKYLDTRGIGSANGGYVLLSPSRTLKGEYQWINESKLAPLDAWVVEACGEGTDDDPASQEPLVELDLPGNIEWARHWLANDALISRQGAGGDDTLVNRVVPVLKDHGISEETAGELLAKVWNGRCEPPWRLGDCADADNLFVKVHNGYLYCRDRQPGVDTAQAAFPPWTDADEAELNIHMAQARKFDREWQSRHSATTLHGRRFPVRRTPKKILKKKRRS